MATPTQALIRASAQLQGNFKTTDTRLTTSAWLDIVNRALRQIALDHDWYWLLANETLTLTAGTATVAPGAATYLRTRTLTHNDVGTPLYLREISELDRVTRTGRPIIYAVDNSTINVKPIPDSAYVLVHRYVKSETVMTGDSDVPLIPMEMSEGVILYATKLAFEFIRDTDKAKAAEADYAKWLRRAQDNNARTAEPFRPRIRPGSLF